MIYRLIYSRGFPLWFTFSFFDGRKTNAFHMPWHCFNWLFRHFWWRYCCSRWTKTILDRAKGINNAKTRFNWIEFTDNDDCKANRRIREVEREENTATALRKKKSFYKGPHLNDTFVIFCHVTHASTKKHPVPFFWKNFSKAFSFFFHFEFSHLSRWMK